MNGNSLRKEHLFFLIGSIALILFLLESLMISLASSYVSWADRNLIQLVQSGISASGIRLMLSMTQLGSPAAIALLSLLLVVFLISINKSGAALWFLATLLFGSIIVNPLLKQLFGRPRPAIHRILIESGFSYPSGHATAATLFFGLLIILSLRYARQRLIRIASVLVCGAAILMVMLSRVYLGVHYPSDVLAGLLTGTAIDCFSAGLSLRRSLHIRRYATSGNEVRKGKSAAETQDQCTSS